MFDLCTNGRLNHRLIEKEFCPSSISDLPNGRAKDLFHHKFPGQVKPGRFAETYRRAVQKPTETIPPYTSFLTWFYLHYPESGQDPLRSLLHYQYYWYCSITLMVMVTFLHRGCVFPLSGKRKSHETKKAFEKGTGLPTKPVGISLVKSFLMCWYPLWSYRSGFHLWTFNFKTYTYFIICKFFFKSASFSWFIFHNFV